MATSATTSHAIPKLQISKWLANKSLKLSFNNRRRSKSKSRSSSSSSPPSSNPNSPSSSPNESPILVMPSSADDRNQHPSQSTPRNDDKLEDELRQVFRRFDANDDGKISALELRSYFGSIGEYMSHEQAKAVIEDFDADGDELLDFQEFLGLVAVGRPGEDRGDRDDLKSAFEMFELEKGCITPRSVQRMLNRLGDTRTYDECKAMVQVFDKDGNGVLDFNEFHQMMMA